MTPTDYADIIGAKDVVPEKLKSMPSFYVKLLIAVAVHVHCNLIYYRRERLQGNSVIGRLEYFCLFVYDANLFITFLYTLIITFIDYADIIGAKDVLPEVLKSMPSYVLTAITVHLFCNLMSYRRERLQGNPEIGRTQYLCLFVYHSQLLLTFLNILTIIFIDHADISGAKDVGPELLKIMLSYGILLTAFAVCITCNLIYYRRKSLHGNAEIGRAQYICLFVYLTLLFIAFLNTFTITFFVYSEIISVVVNGFPGTFVFDAFIGFMLIIPMFDSLYFYIIIYCYQLWTDMQKETVSETVNVNHKQANVLDKVAEGESDKELQMKVNLDKQHEVGNMKLSSEGDKEGEVVSPVGGPSTLAPTEYVKPNPLQICFDNEKPGSVNQQLTTTSKPKTEVVSICLKDGFS